MNKTKITAKQRQFADNILAGDNKTIAALKAYETNSKDVAKRLGSLTYKLDNVQAYLNGEALGASERIVEMSKNAENEGVKLKANENIMKYTGYDMQAKENPDNTGQHENQSEHLEAMLKAIKSGDTVELQRIVLNPS